jgi:hypothetical protein
MKKVIILLIVLINLLNFNSKTIDVSSDITINYDWYKTQANTGKCSFTNCGPACASMVIKYSKNIDVSVKEIRNIYYNDCNWWYTSNIKDVLSIYDIKYKVKHLNSKEDVLLAISKKHLIIACLDISKISFEKVNNSKYNKYYENDVTGHFIILKGYLEDKEWLKVYDPYVKPENYYNKKIQNGKNRLYNINEVYNSMKSWWGYYIEVM